MGDLSELIGERIREIRKEKGLSQEELAYKASLHYTFIGKVERGEKNVSIESLQKIAKALDITLEEFFSTVDPAKNTDVSTELEQIIKIIKNRSLYEQTYILRITKEIINLLDNK